MAEFQCSEVLDLTHSPTVELLRNWDQKEFAYIQMLRFIRISNSEPTVFTVSKYGKHHTLGRDGDDPAATQPMDIIHDTSIDEFLKTKHFSSTAMVEDLL